MRTVLNPNAAFSYVQAIISASDALIKLLLQLTKIIPIFTDTDVQQPIILLSINHSKFCLLMNFSENNRIIVLTQREKEVLKAISYGYTTSEIAKELALSKHTVITYRKILFRKLNVLNAPLMVRRGFELGLLEYSDHQVSEMN